MTPAEFRALPKATPSKYRNRVTVVDGVRFDSAKEARRLSELALLERAGEITELRRQVTYALDVNGHSICRYIADAVYRDRTGSLVVEDVKSPATRKLPAYRIKAKLMKAIHGVEIVET